MHMGGLLLEDGEIDKDVNILTGITSGLKREELILLGTYTIGDGRGSGGLLFHMADLLPTKIHYTPFTDLSALLELPSCQACFPHKGKIEGAR